MDKSYKYYLFHKPFGVLSQFTREIESHVTLQDYLEVEKDVYPVGRLDKDSEGLLLLTNDNNLKFNLLSPENKRPKTYLAQLEGTINMDAIESLSKGVDINVNKKIYKTLPAQVTTVIKPHISPRKPPVRHREKIPTSWIQIKIYEGKNRQIRKMCAKVGFPVLRLIRTAICDLNIELPIGEYIELTKDQLLLLR